MTARSQAPRRVLVTGHSGFIGQHLTQRLERDGVVVTGASRSNGFDVTRDAPPLDGVDHVHHLAGLSFVPDSWRDPAAFHLVNTHGTLRMLEACHQAGVSITLASTYVYAPDAPQPVPETAPPKPSSPYAYSKLAAEEACGFYARAFGLKTSILRLFNAYGPGQAASFLTPTIARQALDPDAAEIVVADLSPRRDFIHVDDVVEALLVAPGLPPGSVFNVGSGRSRSVGDVARACLAAAGVIKPVRARDERRDNEISDIVADISALTAASGWRPKVGFEAGMATVIEAMRSR